MKSMITTLITLAYLFVSQNTLLGQDDNAAGEKKNDDPNPLYLSWEKHPVGTTIVLSSLTMANGQEVAKMKITQKLVSKDEDKVVIEMSNTINSAGREFSTPATKLNIEKFGKKMLPGQQVENSGDAKTEKGDETLTVGGKSLKCNWTQYTMQTAAGETKTKAWMCDEVPGMMVKTVTSTGDNETTMKLESIEKE